MFGVGKLLSSVVKIVNAPIRAVEDVCGVTKEKDRVLSKPLEALAKELKDVDKEND